LLGRQIEKDDQGIEKIERERRIFFSCLKYARSAAEKHRGWQTASPAKN
jgi:hypothetical protein